MSIYNKLKNRTQNKVKKQFVVLSHQDYLDFLMEFREKENQPSASDICFFNGIIILISEGDFKPKVGFLEDL